MKRALAALGFLLAGCGSAPAGSLALLGAGGAGAAPPASCSFLPAAFSTATLYISWTTADGLGSFGMACLNGTTSVAASTLGAISGSGSAGATGLVLTGGFFQFSNVTWLAQNSGALYVNFTPSAVTGTRVIFEVSDGTTSNQQVIQIAAGTIRSSLAIGGSSVAALNSAVSAVISTPYKIAVSYTNGAQILCVNGAGNATASGAGSLSGLTASNIGASPTGVLVTAGTITETAFFSIALASTAACDTLTTP